MFRVQLPVRDCFIDSKIALLPQESMHSLTISDNYEDPTNAIFVRGETHRLQLASQFLSQPVNLAPGEHSVPCNHVANVNASKGLSTQTCRLVVGAI